MFQFAWTLRAMVLVPKRGIGSRVAWEFCCGASRICVGSLEHGYVRKCSVTPRTLGFSLCLELLVWHLDPRTLSFSLCLELLVWHLEFEHVLGRFWYSHRSYLNRMSDILADFLEGFAKVAATVAGQAPSSRVPPPLHESMMPPFAEPSSGKLGSKAVLQNLGELGICGVCRAWFLA